jgi:diketogulonate reductase-like aldo/keto reductase
MSTLDRRAMLKLLAGTPLLAACDRPSSHGSAQATTPNEGTSPKPTGTAEKSAGGSDKDSTYISGDGPIKRQIPKLDVSIPIVGLGTWQQFDVRANSPQMDQLREVVAKMVEHGGEVIDSSPMYGRSETVIGRLVEELDVRDEVFLATKVWTSGKQSGVDQMNRSFERFQVETVDLMQVHNLLDWRAHLDTLQKWKDEGRLRTIGVTHYTNSALPRLIDVISDYDVDFVQLAYSIANRAPEDEMLAAAAENDVATLINRPYAQGSLFGRASDRELPPWAADLDIDSWGQYFLKYLLGDERVTCVIPGTSDPEHVVDNVGAAYGALPDQDQRQRMLDYWEG